MASEIQAEPVLDADVFVIALDDLPQADMSATGDGVPPPTVNGRPITALAPHPQLDDLVYVTTGTPDALAFLPDPYVELD